MRSLTTARDDQCLHPAGDIVRRQPGALLQQLKLVVVDTDPAGLVYESFQILAVEHRQALPRIEHKRNTSRNKLRGMLDHALAAIR
jgi:hypothetical protein